MLRLFANYLRLRSPRALVWFALLVLWPTAAARADEITIWNFNSPKVLTPSFGSGTLTTNFNSTSTLAGSPVNARMGDPAGNALALGGGTTNDGRNLTANVSTAGFTNIIVSFATRRSETGFSSNQFQYSLDGATYLNFGGAFNPVTTTAFELRAFDLSAIAGLNNNPLAAFRIIFSGATSTGGINRIDNLVIEGTRAPPAAVPEPTTMLLLSTGLAGMAATKARRRRRVSAGIKA